MGWSELRTYGPLPSMRFDPHPQPLGAHDEGALYAALDLTTALAEVFQASRAIDVRSFAPWVTSWMPVRELALLDLTDTWALRNGAAPSLSSAPRSVCRSWARAIRASWPGLDGLLTPSTMTGRPCVVLWNPARNSFPARSAFSRALASPELLALVDHLASRIAYRVVG